MGNRREQRTRIALPVKVYTRDKDNRQITEIACTMDLAPRGVRLSGVRCVREPGEVLLVERGKHKAFYQVMWIGTRADAREGQVGLQCIEPEASIWGFDVLAGEDERYESIKSGDRRQAARFPCAGTVHIFSEGRNEPQYGELSELNALGCYVRMAAPLSDGARVRLKLKIPAHKTEFSVKGTVGVAQRGFGMVVNFLEITPEEKPLLEALLKQLNTAAAGARV